MTITVDKVLRVRGKMLRNKPNGPADGLVTEMLQCPPTETVNEVTHWFDKRFKGECRAPEAWKVLRLVFLKKPDAKLEKGLRGFRAIAPMSVFSKWYTTVLVDLLHEEKEPDEWRRFARGSRERSKLRTHAGHGDEYLPMTLGMARGQTNRPAAGTARRG